MLLYHGSNVKVSKPHIINTNRGLDFGPGFYTTSNIEQAKRWAELKAKRRGKGSPMVSVFYFDEQNLYEELNIKIFETANIEWLDYVVANRKGKYEGEQYDIVIGPVANDRTILIINDYISGAFPAETALALLEPAKLSEQYTFLTYAGIKILTFKEVLTNVR